MPSRACKGLFLHCLHAASIPIGVPQRWQTGDVIKRIRLKQVWHSQLLAALQLIQFGGNNKSSRDCVDFWNKAWVSTGYHLT
jgi:hypothetical protein